MNGTLDWGHAHHFDTVGCNGATDEACARFKAQLAQSEHQERGHYTPWGIPARVTWRHSVTLQDEALHDDHLMSVSLVSVLADADLQPHTATSTPAPRRKLGRPNDDWRLSEEPTGRAVAALEPGARNTHEPPIRGCSASVEWVTGPYRIAARGRMRASAPLRRGFIPCPIQPLARSPRSASCFGTCGSARG